MIRQRTDAIRNLGGQGTGFSKIPGKTVVQKVRQNCLRPEARERLLNRVDRNANGVDQGDPHGSEVRLPPNSDRGIAVALDLGVQQDVLEHLDFHDGRSPAVA